MNLKHLFLFGIVLVVLSGCGNTADGMKKDSAENGANSSAESQKAMESAKETGSNIGAATMLTPKIKMAFTSNPVLNDAKNLINVDSTDAKVTLTGHVMTQEMKTLAGELAAEVMKDNKATQPVENNLEIKP